VHIPPNIRAVVRRHRTACAILARQIALKEAGPMADEYFAKYRPRLLAEAKEIIAYFAALFEARHEDRT
jgi:hypothetical protein